jgi:hypothetical protein
MLRRYAAETYEEIYYKALASGKLRGGSQT